MKPQRRETTWQRDYIILHMFGKFGEHDNRVSTRITGYDRPSWDGLQNSSEFHVTICHPHCILGTVKLLGSITNTCVLAHNIVQHGAVVAGAPADGSTEPQEVACLGKC